LGYSTRYVFLDPPAQRSRLGSCSFNSCRPTSAPARLGLLVFPDAEIGPYRRGLERQQGHGPVAAFPNVFRSASPSLLKEPLERLQQPVVRCWLWATQCPTPERKRSSGQLGAACYFAPRGTFSRSNHCRPRNARPIRALATVGCRWNPNPCRRRPRSPN